MSEEVALRGLLPCLQRRCAAAAVRMCALGSSLTAEDSRGLLRSDSIFWRNADAAPPPRKSKTGLRGERLAVVFEPIGDEDNGEEKPVWSNGEARVETLGAAAWDDDDLVMPRVSGGGRFRVGSRTAGGGGPCDDGDGGSDCCDSRDGRTDGGISVGTGGGTATGALADDLDIFDEMDARE